MIASSRLSLPFIVPGQAQKEVFHNEALQRLDLLVQTVVEVGVSNAPPQLPEIGKVYRVGPSPSGAWDGQANALAGWTQGGWRFVAAFEGLRMTLRQTGEPAIFRAGAWLVGVVDVTSIRIGDVPVVGTRTAAIPSPTGGTVQDTEGRVALNAILISLRSHGLIGT